MMKKEFRLKRNGKVVVIIDEENSLLAKIIKDNFLNRLRKRKSAYDIYSLNKEEGYFLIEEYNLTEFPSVLYLKDQQLIYQFSGFSYFEVKKEKVA